MTPLGKSLVFNLKYLAEMNRLSELDQSATLDIDGLTDAKQVFEMAGVVGAAAKTNALEFLTLCASGIASHFKGLGIVTLGKPRSRSKLAKNWWWQVEIHLPSVPKSTFVVGVSIMSAMDVGIAIQPDVCGVVVPWLWVNGRRSGEDKVIGILGSGVHSRAGDGLTIHKGTLALACIPITPQPRHGFDVDRDPLIAEVMAAFARIGAEQTVAIANSGVGLKPHDDI